MTVDEELDALGTTLFVPPDQEGHRQDIEVMLPQFARSGQERIVYRDLPFVHRFHVPENPDGTTLVLLHGTGGTEASLMPLAARIAPAATLLGVRGRSTEEGIQRWFRRVTDLTFDQADIRSEAEAFAAFLDGVRSAYGLDPARTVFLGYSNGADFIGAATAEGRAVPAQNPPRSQEAAIIQVLAAQMTRRLEQEYWRTRDATLPPSDVATLCVARAHQIYPLGDLSFAPDQAIRLRIDLMRKCFVAQGYQER